MQCGHAVLRDAGAEIIWFLVTTGFGDGQPGTDHHRPEKLPDRNVEAERRFLQHNILRRQWISLLHPK
ncbi:Uncharacterised protein [Acinetobacter baumannii]|nr:Uncharacterised protein [Acinetobacter baumannii]